MSFHDDCNIMTQTLEKTEVAIENEHSRETGNIGHRKYNEDKYHEKT